jgi:hypothetical protein
VRLGQEPLTWFEALIEWKGLEHNTLECRKMLVKNAVGLDHEDWASNTQAACTSLDYLNIVRQSLLFNLGLKSISYCERTV